MKLKNTKPRFFQKIETSTVSGLAYATTVKVHNMEIGGVAVFMSSKQCDVLGIRQNNLLQPARSFRTYNVCERHYCVDILILFESGYSVRVQLEPSHYSTKDFFKKVIETRNIAFVFINKDTNLESCCYFEISEEEYSWFERNSVLINNLSQNNDFNKVVSELIISPNDFIFRFDETKTLPFLDLTR